MERYVTPEQHTSTVGRLSSLEQRYRQLYTHEASSYDLVRFSHAQGARFNQREHAAIDGLLGLQPGQQVLDVAAGTGRVAAYLAHQQLQVTAVDLTRNMLRQAQAAADTARAQITFVEANGRMLPFADARFDAVISIRFLHLLPARFHRTFVVEMWRVLRPGGVLLVQFDSAVAGGIVTYPREAHRRLVRRQKARYYTWPHHIAQVFADVAPRSIHASPPVGARLMAALHLDSAATVEPLLQRGWRSFLANRILVRAVKPS